MAAAMFRKAINEAGLPIEVESAGLAAVDGSGASQNAVQVLARRGLDLSVHKARRVEAAMMERADLILTMTRDQKRLVLESWPQTAGKVFTLAEYGSAAEGGDEPAFALDIADPFGGDLSEYEACADQIERAVASVVDRLRSQTDAASSGGGGS